jgi:ABC-type branched-subunit amino acid transport system ATPase component
MFTPLVSVNTANTRLTFQHPEIATIMNVYGNTMMESKREANSKVVQMALRTPQ